MTIPSLSSSVLGTIYSPPKQDSLFSTRNLALGGLAATSITAGGIIGKLKGHPLIGAGIGAAVAAVALGAALLGNASQSYYDYPDSGGGRNYPTGGGRHTSPGDDGGSSWPGSGGGHTSPGDSGSSGGTGGSHSSGNSTDNGNPSESDF